MTKIIPLPELNANGLFGMVGYLEDINLSAEQRDKYFAITREVIQDLSQTTDDDFSRFLTQELKFDYITGLANLSISALIIHSSENLPSGMSFHYDSDGRVRHVLTLAPKQLNEKDENKIATIIAHEFGEMLQNSGTIIQQALQTNTQAINLPYKKGFKKNWEGEYNADKIAVAINPLKYNIGKMLEGVDPKHSFLNDQYQRKEISKSTANALAVFTTTRDSILLSLFSENEDAARYLDRLNDKFNMKCDFTHPSNISRAIEGEKFTAKCANFLNKSKP